MALSRTDRSNAQTTGGVSATNTVSSASFTPAVGSLLVVSISGIFNDGGAGATTFSVANTGYTTTGWTQAGTRSFLPGGGYSMRTAQWTAQVTSSAAGVITVTRTAGSIDQWMIAQFGEWAGHGGPGMFASNDDGLVSGTTLTITFASTPATTSGVVGIVQDNNGSAGGITQPTGWTESLDAASVPEGNSVETAFLIGSVVQAPQWTTFQTGAFGKCGSALEILAASTVVYPVGPRQRTRRALPKPRTRHARTTPAQVNPPMALKSLSQTRQLRGLPVRRGHMATVIPPQFNPPLLPPRPTQHRLWPGWLRRGRTVSPVPAQQNPVIVPPKATQHRPLATLLRRGRAVSPVPPQQNPIIAPPVATQARRLRGWPVRRGRSVSPVPVQQALPTNPTFNQVNDQHRLWAGWLRRSRQATVIPPQFNPPLPPGPPQRRRIAGLLRRSVHTDLPATQDRVQPIRRPRRPSVAPLRRSGHADVPALQDRVQPIRRPKPPAPLSRRARQPQSIPAPTVVIPNPPLPTKTATIRRLAGWLLRRGRKAEQGWPQGVDLSPPPIVQPTGLVLAGSELTLDVMLSITRLEVTGSETALPITASGTQLTIGDPNTFLS